jgi:curved DNA-binding protein CbpA
MTITTACAILGVPTDSDAKTIKSTYLTKVKEFHPDTHPGDALAAAKFREVKQAYDLLIKAIG